MTRALKFIASLCILICSCDNQKTTDKIADKNNSANDRADLSKLNDFLKNYEEPSQTLKVSSNKPSVVTGRKGTKISIIPTDLETESGKPLGKNINVELKELTNQNQLLKTNAQTVSNKKLLVSGGAYFIGMTSNGEQLKLKEGKSLNVQFPKLSDKEMRLFYGQRDELGKMNWEKATETFKETQQPPTQQKTDSIRTVITTKRKSDIDAILDYVDSGDTTTTQEERKTIIKRQKEYRISQKVYDEIGIAKLGWINCDRFLEEGKQSDLYVNFQPEDSVTNANVYLVFKSINSVIQEYFYSDKAIQFDNLPIGYKTRLIAYTVKGEKVLAYSTDLTIAKGQTLTLDLKEISEKDFKKLISN